MTAHLNLKGNKRKRLAANYLQANLPHISDRAFMTRNIALRAMSLANKISLKVKSDEACA